jgi:hypothetical protein
MWTRARLVIAVPYGLRAVLPSAHVSQRHKGRELSDHLRDAEVARMSAELDALARYADAQEQRVGHLQTALESRIVIEQAVGMLAERFNLTVADSFELLRSAARNSRRELRGLALETTQSRVTPDAIASARAVT